MLQRKQQERQTLSLQLQRELLANAQGQQLFSEHASNKATKETNRTTSAQERASKEYTKTTALLRAASKKAYVRDKQFTCSSRKSFEHKTKDNSLSEAALDKHQRIPYSFSIIFLLPLFYSSLYSLFYSNLRYSSGRSYTRPFEPFEAYSPSRAPFSLLFDVSWEVGSHIFSSYLSSSNYRSFIS